MAATGRASSFASPEEREQLEGIEKLTRAKLARAEVPRESETFRAESARIASAQQDPGAGARPAGMNRNRKRAAAHNARRPGRPAARPAQVGGHERTDAQGHAAGDAAKPKLVGSWSSKRRR